MTDRPDYLGDRPVQVQIGSLREFAALIQSELDSNVAPNVAAVRHRLGLTDCNRSFGRDSRYQNGVRIGNYHDDCRDRAEALLTNLLKGLQAVAWAAQGIAEDFADAEDLNSMDLASIDTYLTGMTPHPPPPPASRPHEQA